MSSFHRRSPIVPTLRYRDVEGALAWLTTAFGFSPHTILRTADGRVASAQLVHGTGMIILAPVGDSEFDELMRQPDEIGGAETQSCYFIVADADAHYAVARSVGAEMILDLQNFEHGGRGYLCRDPEGHLWSFGTFNPWDGASEPSAKSPVWSQLANLSGGQTAVVAGIPALLLVGAVAAFAWWGGITPGDGVTRQALQAEQSARAEAERKAGAAQAELARLREDHDATDLDSAKLQEQVVHLAAGKEKAEAGMKKLADQVSQLQLAKTAADRALRQHMARAVRDRRLRERIRRESANLQAATTSQTAAAQRATTALQEAQSRLDKEVAARKSAQAEQARVEQLLAEEREAKAQAETGLQQVSEQLKQEQAARRAAELAQQEAPVPAPRPAVRPER